MFEISVDFDKNKLQTWANDIGESVNHWDRLVRNAVAITAKETALVAKSFIGTSGPPRFNRGGYSARPWQPIKEASLRARKKNGENPSQILLDTGALQRSVGFKVAGGQGYIFSTDSKAGGHEQTGRDGTVNAKNVPARPFLTPAMYYVQYDTMFEAALEKFVKQNFDFMDFDKRHRAEDLFYKASVPKSSGVSRAYKSSARKTNLNRKGLNK